MLKKNDFQTICIMKVGAAICRRERQEEIFLKALNHCSYLFITPMPKSQDCPQFQKNTKKH